MLTDAACRNATCPEGKARARLPDSDGLYLEVAAQRLQALVCQVPFWREGKSGWRWAATRKYR